MYKMDDLENQYENEAWAGMEDMYDCCGGCDTEPAQVNTVELRAQIVAHLLPYYEGTDTEDLLIVAKNLESYILHGI
jgi:hypothetical protein